MPGQKLAIPGLRRREELFDPHPSHGRLPPHWIGSRPKTLLPRVLRLNSKVDGFLHRRRPTNKSLHVPTNQTSFQGRGGEGNKDGKRNLRSEGKLGFSAGKGTHEDKAKTVGSFEQTWSRVVFQQWPLLTTPRMGGFTCRQRTC